ncbi:major capsid protein [Salmonella virus STSR3]|nr:major capsid protein [Salmonella virus STSR3]
MFFNGVTGDEHEIAEKDLKLPGIESSIARGELKVKTMKISTKQLLSDRQRKEKDPDDGKTIKELEDGGVYENKRRLMRLFIGGYYE